MKRYKKQPNVHKNNGCLFLKEGFIMNQKIPNYINQLKKILNVESIDIDTITYTPASSEPEHEIELPIYTCSNNDETIHIINDFQGKVFDVFLPYNINGKQLLKYSKVLKILSKNKSDKTVITESLEQALYLANF